MNTTATDKSIETSPFVRCTKCQALTYVNAAVGLGDSPRCLGCGNVALPVDLLAASAERRRLVGEDCAGKNSLPTLLTSDVEPVRRGPA